MRIIWQSIEKNQTVKSASKLNFTNHGVGATARWGQTEAGQAQPGIKNSVKHKKMSEIVQIWAQCV